MVDDTGNAMKGYCLSLCLPFSLSDQFHDISDFLILDAQCLKMVV